MRKYSRLIVLLLIFALTPLNSSSFAEDYFVYKQYGGTWHDANKTWSDDSLMCWAASASNVLAWTGWWVTGHNTATTIFDHFKDNWTHCGGNAVYAFQWWLDGFEQQPKSTAQLNNLSSGNFWPFEKSVISYSQIFNTKIFGYLPSGDLLNEVKDYLYKGSGVVLGLDKVGAEIGHAITAWGFEYSGELTNPQYTAIWITDSDSRETELKKYSVNWNASNNWWDIEGYYGYHIEEVVGLSRNDQPMAISSDTHINKTLEHGNYICDKAPIFAGGNILQPGAEVNVQGTTLTFQNLNTINH
jgi:hypothetical protein